MLEFLQLCEARAEAYGQYQRYLKYMKDNSHKIISDGFTEKVKQLAQTVQQLDQKIYFKKFFI